MDLRLTLLLALGVTCALASNDYTAESMHPYADRREPRQYGDGEADAEWMHPYADRREPRQYGDGEADAEWVHPYADRREPRQYGAFRREPATFTTYQQLMERRQARVLASIGGGKVPLGTVSWKPAKSCKAIKDNMKELPSGIYYIYYKKTNLVQIFRTYCQMTIDGGAWTFIPRQAVIRGSTNQGLIDQLFTDKEEVLLVIHQPGFKKKQRFTTIRQIAEYSHIDLSLTMNDHGTSPRPASYDMGPYLYLRILPTSISEKKTWMGFQVNGHDAKYHNCLGRRSNYWALYPNDNNREPQKRINKHCNTQPCVFWISHGVSMYGPQEVPNDMLFYAEMHFGQQGGCGTEQVSDGSFMSYSLGIAVR